jgi:hypothetical protein
LNALYVTLDDGLSMFGTTEYFSGDGAHVFRTIVDLGECGT